MRATGIYSPIVQWLRLSERAGDHHFELAADVYVSIDVIALPIAFRLRELNGGGRIFCDVKESPRLNDRSLPSTIAPVPRDFLDAAFAWMLEQCDHRFTVGWALAEQLAERGVMAEVLPNYRTYAEPNPTGWLREHTGIGPNAPIALVINNVVGGLEDVLRAAAEIPSLHVVLLGHIKPDRYRESIDELVDLVGLTERFHLVEPVPYERLIHVAADATFGVVLLDSSITNHRVSLPNRIFDLLGAELPVATPEIADIARIVQTHDAGVVLSEVTANSWREAFVQLVSERPSFAANAQSAARALRWSRNEQLILDRFGEAKTVTFVHHRNLHVHQRTRRIADTLAGAGISVRYATHVSEEVPADFPYPVLDLGPASLEG
jgi:glycosyltransferase involved in cell wall biosynthesis